MDGSPLPNARGEVVNPAAPGGLSHFLHITVTCRLHKSEEVVSLAGNSVRTSFLLPIRRVKAQSFGDVWHELNQHRVELANLGQVLFPEEGLSQRLILRLVEQ